VSPYQDAAAAGATSAPAPPSLSRPSRSLASALRYPRAWRLCTPCRCAAARAKGCRGTGEVC